MARKKTKGEGESFDEHHARIRREKGVHIRKASKK